MYCQECVITGGSRDAMALHPPAFISDRMASGANPSTIRKNCSTSL